jgi:predicted phosphodiesterase
MEFGGFDKAAFEKLLRILEGVRGELYVLVLGDISPDEEQAKGFLEELPGEKVFVKGEADPEMEDAMPACMLEIDGVKLLLMHGKILEPYTRGFESPAQLLLHLLRARHLNPSHLGSDPYLLEVVPDICAIGHFHEAGMLNYKGTTILTLGSFRTKPIYWIIDLKTREISRIELGK